MKRTSNSEIAKLEKKINLLNDKLDVLMQALNVTLERPQEQIDKEEEKKRKARERQQARILQKQNIEAHVKQVMADFHLRRTVGYELQRQFKLATAPSAARIREYQRTQDPKAFNGLKRVG